MSRYAMKFWRCSTSSNASGVSPILFISHDMGAVAQLAGEVAVLYLGKVVEAGPAETVIRHPLHPYTARA